MLTDIAIRQAKPRVERYEIKDASRPGLRVVVFPTGQKSFVYRFRLNGVFRKVTLGKYPDMTLADAIAAHRAATDQKISGIDPSKPSRTVADDDDTLAAWIVRYETEKVETELRKSTQAYYKRNLDHLQDAFPGAGLADIRRSVFTAAMDKIKRARGPMAAMEFHKVAKTFLHWCEQRSDDFVSPVTAIDPPGEYTKRKRVLDDSELVKVWKPYLPSQAESVEASHLDHGASTEDRPGFR
jgi:hypothetical protein